MNKSIVWRVWLLAVIVTGAIILFLPSVPQVRGSLPEWWTKSTILGNKINLGLDLQGGMHLVYQVQTEKAVESATSRFISNLKATAAEKNVVVTDMRQTSASTFETTLEKPADAEDFLNMVSDLGTLEKQSQEGGRITVGIKKDEIERIKDNSVVQAVETIRNRIDALGVAEPVIVRQGIDELLIQLPGVKDPQRALDIIGKTAQLQFKMLDETNQVTPALPGSVMASEADALVAQYAGKLPEGDEILFERITDPATGSVSKRPYLIKGETMMTGDSLTEARVAISGRDGRPEVAFKLDPAGAKLFESITANNVNKRFAIILDGNVYSAPVIQERIAGGSGVITGSFSETEAKDLAIVLRAGALPAPLKPLQNLTVGATLGNDSIEAGKNAILLGAFLVVVFMAVYYRMSGVIADFAVMLNIIVLIGALAALSATLTLPGLAGILLTIGMGVDSNVLIFERIREELRLGKTVRSAIDGGYDKAFSTVFDSHVTTLITALVLFQFGTGPVKGFAVTLALGIVINLFTALVGTKVVFDFINSRKKLDTLSI
ncbi:MAG: protein translocase subunit SecD [Nitrospirae bacterium]|nr:protein translocase subunit SecD [Nitrospirota bacterium]